MVLSEDQAARKRELVLRAYELARGYGEDHPTGRPMSSYAVGREMGVSQPTANRYIREAAEYEGHLDLLDHAETRLGMAARLAKYIEWINEEAEKRDANPERGSKVDLIPIAIKIEDRLAALTGADAPAKIEHSGTGNPQTFTPDPRIAADVRAAQAQATRELRAIEHEHGIATTIDQPPDDPEPETP